MTARPSPPPRRPPRRASTSLLPYESDPEPARQRGSYKVIATIDDPLYQGVAISTLTIGQATATVQLGDLAANFDGTPKAATATTTPPGLSVTLTYDGGSTVPSAVGSYTVVGTVTDPNYTGSAQGTLVISQLVGSTFGSWQQLYTISGAPTDTPQNDGVSLLMKYLYDIDPTRNMIASDQGRAAPCSALPR